MLIIEQIDKRIEQQHAEIMSSHNEIKLLMRWNFGALLLVIASLVVAVLRLMH